jgi:putative aldouronate transport system substrate-binding protein
MHSRIRIIAIVVAVLLTLSLMAACTGGTTTTTGQGGTTTTKATTKATTTGTTAPGPKPSITVYGPSNVEEFPSGENENNNLIINYIKEMTGYDVNWIIAPRDNAREAMNMLMASGNPPDMLYTGSKDIFADYTNQGLLEPVDSFIDATTNIKTVVSDATWKAVELNGEHFAVPVPQNQFSSSGVVVRKDLLNKLGNPAMNTLDDYVAFLEMVLEQKLGGDDTIPYVAHSKSMGVFELAFGLNEQYKPENGKLVATWISENARKMLEFSADLFARKLVDQEFAVNTGTIANEKMTNGRGAMYTTGWTTMKELEGSLAGRNVDYEYAIIQPPQGYDGKPTYFNLNAPVRVYFLFPAGAKTEEAIMFLDRCISDDIRLVISYGWENKHYTVNTDGVIEQTDEAENIRYRIYYNMWDTEKDFLNRVKLKGFASGYFPMSEYCKYDVTLNYAPPIAEVTEYASALTDLRDEYFLKIITGAWTIDKFDEFVSKWKASGGEQVLKAVNDWYDTFK